MATQFNIDGMREQYPDRWLLIAVADADEEGQPAGGKLIAHSQHREAILEFARQHAAENPDVERLIFFTGEQDGISQAPITAQESEVSPTDGATEAQEEQASTNVANWTKTYSRFRP